MAADFEVSLGLNTRPFLNQLNAVRRLVPQTLGPVFSTLFGGGSTAGLGQATAAINQFSSALRQSNAISNQAATGFTNLGSNVRRGSRGFFESAIIASKWVLAYGALFSLIRAGQNEVTQFARTVVGLDETQRQFLRILSDIPGSQRQVNIILDQAGVSAKAFATNLDAVLEVQKDFLLQGRSVTETILLTNATLLGAKVGFSDVTTVSKALSAILNSLGLSAGFATEAIDILNTVSKTSAVEFNELAEAIRTSVLPARQAELSIQELAGVIAAVSEATRKSGNEIGTALRSVFVFFRRPETINAIKALTAGLGEFRVEVVNDAGQVKPFLQLIGETAVAMDRLNESQRLQVLSALGSIRRNQEVAAIFERFPTLLKQTISATFAAGSATNDLSISLGSVRANIERTRVAIQAQALAMRESLIPLAQAATRAFLNFATGLAELVTTPTGLLVTLGSVALIAAIKISTLTATVTTFSAVLGTTTTTVTGLTAAWAGLTAVFTPTRLLILGVVGAFALIASAVGSSIQSATIATQGFKEELSDLETKAEQLAGAFEAVRSQAKTLEDLAKLFEVFTKGGRVDLLNAISEGFRAVGITVRPTVEGLQDINAEVARLRAQEADLRAKTEAALAGVVETARKQVEFGEEELKRLEGGFSGVTGEAQRLKDAEIAVRAELERLTSGQVASQFAIERQQATERRLAQILESQAKLGDRIADTKSNILDATQRLHTAEVRLFDLGLERVHQLEDEASAEQEFLKIQGEFLALQLDINRQRKFFQDQLSAPGQKDALLEQFKRLDNELANFAENRIPDLLKLQDILPDNAEFQQFLATLAKAAIARVSADLSEKEREARVAAINKLLETQVTVERELAQAAERAADVARAGVVLADIRRRRLTESEALQEEIKRTQEKINALSARGNTLAQQNLDFRTSLTTVTKSQFATEEEREALAESVKNLTGEQVDLLRQLIFYQNLLTGLQGRQQEFQNRAASTLDKAADATRQRAAQLAGELSNLREIEAIDLQILAIQESSLDASEKQAATMALLLDRMAALQREAFAAGQAVKDSIGGALTDVLTGQASAAEGFKSITQQINRQVISGQVNALLSRFDPFFTKVGAQIRDSAERLRVAGTQMFEDGTNIFVQRGSLMFRQFIDELSLTLNVRGSGGAASALAFRGGGTFNASSVAGGFRVPTGTFTPASATGGTRQPLSSQDKAALATFVGLQAASLVGSGRPGTGQILGTVGSIAGTLLPLAGVNPAAAAAIAIGAALIGSFLDKGKGATAVESQISQIPPALSITNAQLGEVNRNLVALREEIRPFALPGSYYFRERGDGAGVTIQNLSVGSAREARVVTQDLLRGVRAA